MSEIRSNSGERRIFGWRAAIWVTAAVLLLSPLLAMHFTDKVVWDAVDFLIFAVLLITAGGAVEFAARMAGNAVYRIAVGVAVAAAVMLVWINLAVDLIGSEDDPANLIHGGVLAVAMVRCRGRALSSD